MPVRSLNQSLLRWPDPTEVLQGVEHWARELSHAHPALKRVGVFGSYGRGDAGFGSDLDLVLIDGAAEGSPSQRYRQWPFERLPLRCDALVLTPAEWQELLASGPADPARSAMARALLADCCWVWSREGTGGDQLDGGGIASP